MWQRMLAAVVADGEMGAVDFPVCAALVTAGFGVASFGGIHCRFPGLWVNELRCF